MHGRRTITPGRIITADELQAQGLAPKIILRNDFGIAAIKYERTISPDVAKELARLNHKALDALHGSQIHYDYRDRARYDRNHDRRFSEDGMIPPLTGAIVRDTLAEIVTTTECLGGRASFFVGAAGYTPHVDQKPMAHMHLWPSSREGKEEQALSMLGYSFLRGTLDLVDRADQIDPVQLAKHVQSGAAIPDRLKAGEFYIFNPLFAHESCQDVPESQRPIRVMMYLNPRVHL